MATGSRGRSESAGRHQSSSFLRATDVVALVVFGSASVVAIWFIHHFALNMVFEDQWRDIELIRNARSGGLSLSTLWVQHNENRILFPNLIVLLLAATTHFDVVVEDYLNGILSIATTGLIIAAHRRHSPSTPWIAYCPVALVLLSFVPLGDTLFGFNLTWYLVLFGLAAALYFLDRPVPTRLALIAAVAAAVLGSFSSLQGLLIWPAGLALLFLRRRSATTVVAWVASAAVTITVYFVHFSFASAGDDNSAVFAHPLVTIKFFFSTIGNVLGYYIPAAPGAGSTGDLIVGVVVFAIALWALISGFRRDESSGTPIGVVLILFGLLFTVSITVGRSQLGLLTASRYSIFTLTLWVGAYLVLLSAPKRVLQPERTAPWFHLLRGRPEQDQPGGATPDPGQTGAGAGEGDPFPVTQWAQGVNLAALTTLVGLMVLLVVSGFNGGLQDARGWHLEEVDISDVTVNIDKAPDNLVQSELGSYTPSFMRQMTSYARSNRLSLLGTSAVGEYSRQGLFPDLLTSVERPTAGATLTGNTFLDATVVYPAERTTVRFSVSGGSLHDHIVSTGTPTLYGWIGHWDTETVTNGLYEIRSVVVHAGGRPVSSTPVTVLVENVAAPSSTLVTK